MTGRGRIEVKLLIVVDMQNDFISGALGTAEAVRIVPAAAKKIAEYKARGDKIIFTRDTHGDDYLQILEGKLLPIAHCLLGTVGWRIADALDTSGCRIIDKNTFGSLELAEAAAQTDGLECIELIGLCTDICVISNAMILKARLPETEIIVDSACCAGLTPQSHQNALEAMRMCHIRIR